MMRYDRIGRELAKAYLFGTGFAADVPGGGVGFIKSRRRQADAGHSTAVHGGPLGAWPYLPPFKRRSRTASPAASCCCVRKAAAASRSSRRSGGTSAHLAAIPRHRGGLAGGARRRGPGAQARGAAIDAALHRSGVPARRGQALGGRHRCASSATPPSPCTTRPAPAGWGRTRMSWRWWTPSSSCGDRRLAHCRRLGHAGSAERQHQCRGDDDRRAGGGAVPRMNFDVLIVGAGSAGCVLAGRLSENPALSVGILEAGGPATDPDIAIRRNGRCCRVASTTGPIAPRPSRERPGASTIGPAGA